MTYVLRSWNELSQIFANGFSFDTTRSEMIMQLHKILGEKKHKKTLLNSLMVNA